MDNMFDPSPTLLNHGCHPNIELFNNSLQHVSWNSPDFSLDIFFQSLNCWRIVLVNSGFQVTPEEVVWGSEIWGIRGPWVVCPPQNEPVPWKVLSQVLKSAVWTMRRRPILLENNCIHVNCLLPPYGWNETSLQHANVPFRVSSDSTTVTVFKKIGTKDTILSYCTPHSCFFYT